MTRALLACAALAAACAAGAPRSVTISPRESFGEWHGWGVSLAWWANVFGNAPDATVLADAGFTLNASVAVASLNVSVPGLGLTIARYNVGASSNTTAGGASIVYSPNIPWWKQIQAFWLDWASDDPASSSWDWTRDAAQVRMLQLAAARAGAAAAFEIFSNSPVWWMLLNHNPSGSADGSSDNLQPWNQGNHSYYMAAVAAHAAADWGVSFSTIELFNEPVATWWHSDGTQEGCHFDASTQAAVLATLPAALARVGLAGSIAVAASDESFVDMAASTWAAFDAGARAVVDHVNVHGYEHGGDRAGLYNAVVVEGGKVMRDSEYGDGDGSGQTLLVSLFADWAQLHPRGWCYWQLLDVASGWGPFTMTVDPPAIVGLNTKYFTIAHFSRHIRPGMLVLGTGDSSQSTAAAWDNSTGLLVVVAQNNGTQPLAFAADLSAFGTVPEGAASGQWVTNFTSSVPDPAAAYTPVAGNAAVTSGKVLAFTVPPMTLTTVEVAGVRA